MADKPLSDMQLAFMRALWDLGEGTVAEVQDALARASQELATTTVATVLRRLEKSGHVAHRRDGRQLIYRALVSQEQLGSSALRRLSEGLYGGDVGALLAQLVGSIPVTSRDLDEVRRLIEATREDKP